MTTDGSAKVARPQVGQGVGHLIFGVILVTWLFVLPAVGRWWARHDLEAAGFTAIELRQSYSSKSCGRARQFYSLDALSPGDHHVAGYVCAGAVYRPVVYVTKDFDAPAP